MEDPLGSPPICCGMIQAKHVGMAYGTTSIEVTVGVSEAIHSGKMSNAFYFLSPDV